MGLTKAGGGARFQVTRKDTRLNSMTNVRTRQGYDTLAKQLLLGHNEGDRQRQESENKDALDELMKKERAKSKDWLADNLKYLEETQQLKGYQERKAVLSGWEGVKAVAKERRTIERIEDVQGVLKKRGLSDLKDIYARLNLNRGVGEYESQGLKKARIKEEMLTEARRSPNGFAIHLGLASTRLHSYSLTN